MWCQFKSFDVVSIEKFWRGVDRKVLTWCQFKSFDVVSIQKFWRGVNSKVLTWCRFKSFDVVSIQKFWRGVNSKVLTWCQFKCVDMGSFPKHFLSKACSTFFSVAHQNTVHIILHHIFAYMPLTSNYFVSHDININCRRQDVRRHCLGMHVAAASSNNRHSLSTACNCMGDHNSV